MASPLINPSQIRLIQSARRFLVLSDPDYRLILRNLGGVESSKLLTQTAFEKVMAFLEERGFQSHPAGDHYWRNKLDTRGIFATERAVQFLRQLASDSRYRLEAMCLKFSDGRTEDPSKLTPQECWRVTEMYKKSNDRVTRPEPDRVDPANTAAAPSLFPDTAPIVGLPDVPQAKRQRETVPAKRVDLSYLGPTTEDDIPF